MASTKMTDILVRIIFGWPFITMSLLVSVIGLVTRRYQYLFIGAIFLIPFSFYLGGYPFIRGFAFVLPLCQVGSAFAIRMQKMMIAWLLLLPALLASVWLAVTVLAQSN